MHRTLISTTGITQVGYHEDSDVHGTLELEFESGHVYRFFNVPPKVYDDLMHASSREDYYHTHIGSRFPNSRVA
jgi:KTSC domain